MTPASTPPQIPLCMVGDSITWSDKGDYWRQFMLDHLPRLAFVGSHSSVLGYSHAGEGGNSTKRVLDRLADIPDCPYYSLHIGTNDNNIRDESRIESHARDTAERIAAIVEGLLQKPSASRVFLGSIMPCHTDNPLRDRTNSATNVVLRRMMNERFSKDKVVWVEYEAPLRAIENWQPLIRLHPTIDGYRPIAKILAESIIEALNINDPHTAPRGAAGSGVRVDNLWEGAADGHTRIPVIAGWYTVSFRVIRVTAPVPSLSFQAADPIPHAYERVVPVTAATPGERTTVEMFTNYEGGNRYTRCRLKIVTQGIEISDIMFEKRRPSGAASAYGTGSFLDTQTAPSPGELLELP